ncbi:MAG: hypothetical protein HOP28_18135 [Gemmatimonadales bacterium]|nr:hypothetical protein [Gemmatimonadales bacterium]
MTLLPQTPPNAPLPPGMDPFIFGRLQETVMFAIGMVATIIIAVKVFGPLARAWARRLEGRASEPLRAELDQMREQLIEMDGLRHRVGELEERLEFTERLLAESRSPNMLGRGDGV